MALFNQRPAVEHTVVYEHYIKYILLRSMQAVN